MGKVPPDGGWRVKSRENATRSRRVPRGHIFVHSVIDAYSRLAYSEVHQDKRATTAVEFWRCAVAFFASYGITAKRVLSDNGACYRSTEFARVLRDATIAHTRTRPYHPQTNGKIERFNRTLRDESAFARLYHSEAARIRALDTWPHLYNHHRHHTAIKGVPASRVNNLSTQNS